MKYPKAGDLQRETTSSLTSNPDGMTQNPWEVRSGSGLEGTFSDRDDADFRAGELRRSGVSVTVTQRTKSQFQPKRPAGAPPMYHKPQGRPPGVPNPSQFTAKGNRVFQALQAKLIADGVDPVDAAMNAEMEIMASTEPGLMTAEGHADAGDFFVTHGTGTSSRANPPRFREGARVRFSPTPASLRLYATAPPIGTLGTVTTVSLGSRRASYLPGPGGGLVYVNWDDRGVQGVGPGDLEDHKRGNPPKVKIKMTSTRSGKVGWIRADGTPSDHESEAGSFDQAEADAVIAEYTENLVRVVGRCANRFETLPAGRTNPPQRWMVWFSESPGSYVRVTADGYMDAMRRAAPEFRGAHDNEVREMIAKIDGGRAIESLVTVHRNGRLTFHPSPQRGNPEEGEFFLTDKSEAPICEPFRSRGAAKRAAMKLVRDGEYGHVEVHHRFKGRNYMQGQADADGWSDV